MALSVKHSTPDQDRACTTMSSHSDTDFLKIKLLDYYFPFVSEGIPLQSKAGTCTGTLRVFFYKNQGFQPASSFLIYPLFSLKSFLHFAMAKA